MREEEAAQEAGGQILKRITGTPPATGKTFGLLLLAPQHVQCGINPEGFFCVGGEGGPAQGHMPPLSEDTELIAPHILPHHWRFSGPFDQRG